MPNLVDLNEYLFDALNQITNEDLLDADEDTFKKTMRIGETTVNIADKIIRLNDTVIKAEKVKQEYGLEGNVLGIEMDRRKD